MNQEPKLCCLIHTKMNCAGGCKLPLCTDCGVGHRGDPQQENLYCRPCWWKVWNEALYQSKAKSKASGTTQVDEFEKIMGPQNIWVRKRI